MNDIKSLIPYGYEFICISPVNFGENYLGSDGDVLVWGCNKISDFVTVVIKKKEPKRITFVSTGEFRSPNYGEYYLDYNECIHLNDYRIGVSEKYEILRKEYES